MSEFVCSNCRHPLASLRCTSCGATFEQRDGIPILLPKDKQYLAAAEIGAVYDDIYEHRTGVWENQGRTKEFIQYFSNLVASKSTGRLLEIGCGEGILLAQLNAQSKTAVDISATALQRARANAGAVCAVGVAENLPVHDNAYDIVVSVGVMEHFLDDDAACKDIARVVRPGGHYVALIHVGLTRAEEAMQKLREYVLPIPKPIKLARWLIGKVYRPVRQPIMRRYTVESGRDCIARNGLIVERTITKSSEPSAPLVGPHVVIYVCKKPR